MLNLKFLASTVPEIWRGSQNFKSRSRDPFTTPFDLIVHFLLNTLVANLHAKFEVSSFNRSRDMEGFQNSKNKSLDPTTTPFDVILHFFVRTSSGQSVCQI